MHPGGVLRTNYCMMSFSGALNHSLELFASHHKAAHCHNISLWNKVCTFSPCVTQRGVLGQETTLSTDSKQLHPSSNCHPACPPAILMNVAFLVSQWHTSSSRKKGPLMKNTFQSCGKGNFLKHGWGKSNPLRLKEAWIPTFSFFSIDSDYKVRVRCVQLLSYWNCEC